MKRFRHLSAALFASLILVSPTFAGSPQDLPTLGYSTTSSKLGECRWWSASGFGVSADFGSDCAADFHARLDPFLAGHPERKLAYLHPDAVEARRTLETKGYLVWTSFSPFPVYDASFEVRGGCGDPRAADPASLVGLASSLPAASEPCVAPAPPPGDEPPPEEPPVDDRVSALEAELDRLKAEMEALRQRVAALEAAFAGTGNMYESVRLISAVLARSS